MMQNESKYFISPTRLNLFRDKFETSVIYQLIKTWLPWQQQVLCKLRCDIFWTEMDRFTF